MKKYSLFFLLIILAVHASAQENSTGESISKQYRNNSVPGLKYAPATSSAKSGAKPHATMVEEIKSGKFGRVQSGQASSPAAQTSAKTGDASKLPSNSSASEMEQKEQSKAAKTQVQQAPPMQQEESGSPAEMKTMPALKTKTVPVKKVQQ